jgi:hypothetical protein
MAKYRNSFNNRLTRALFLELNTETMEQVLYTLKDEDVGEYPSLKRLFMEAGDPTEYIFAESYFENFEHWEIICEASWFAPYIAQWRKELVLKIKANALLNIQQEADEGGRNAFAANRFLLTNGWIEGPTTKRGRPSKTEVKEEARRIAEDHFRLDSDIKRMNLPSVGKGMQVN